MGKNSAALVSAIARHARELVGGPDDYSSILARARSARLVLIGEASHGTHEFYGVRAAITKRLVEELGFNAVAVEADWPDAYRVNRYVRGDSRDADASEALADFRRFPQWMWRNADVLDFVGWLRSHNEAAPDPARRVGFFGLDLYSMHASMQAVIDYLDTVDRDAAQRARSRYACFDHFGPDPQMYGYAAGLDLAPTCERQVIAQLVEMRTHLSHASQPDTVHPDDGFFAEQNALLVRNAEEYYRSMFEAGVSSWNIRDAHMLEVLTALLAHIQRNQPRPTAGNGVGPDARVVVWAHNSHLGDARATEMGDSGELNLGQLVRERWPAESLHVGFTTYDGSVTAADDWGEPAKRMTVRPAIPGSYEAGFHELGMEKFALDPGAALGVGEGRELRRLERAIGVIYRPRTERASHYFQAALAGQFDIVLHYDHTRAVEPLERTAQWVSEDLPETYPTAL